MRIYRVEIYEDEPSHLFDIWHIKADNFESAFEKVQAKVGKLKAEYRTGYNIKSITEILVLNS